MQSSGRMSNFAHSYTLESKNPKVNESHRSKGNVFNFDKTTPQDVGSPRYTEQRFAGLPHFLRPDSKSINNSGSRHSSTKQFSCEEGSIHAVTHALLAEMTKSITEITKAQVEQILAQKAEMRKQDCSTQNKPQSITFIEIDTKNTKVEQKKQELMEDIDDEKIEMRIDDLPPAKVTVKTIQTKRMREKPSQIHPKRIYSRYASMQSPVKWRKTQTQQNNFLVEFINSNKKQNKSQCKQQLSTTNFKQTNNMPTTSHENLSTMPNIPMQVEIQEFPQCMRGLYREVRKLNTNTMEPRSLDVEVEFEEISCFEQQKKQDRRIYYLKQCVSKIASEVISVGFNLHYKERMQFEKVKAYCCQNFLHNFCRLTTFAKINQVDMKMLEEHLQNEVLPYLNLSYPRSQEKLSNKQLLSKIDEKDIYNQNKFDVIYNSKISLSTKTKQINAQVMKIMNYLIQLPNQKVFTNQNVTFSQAETKTLYESFEQDMNLILSKVEKRDLVQKMFKFRREDRIKIRDTVLPLLKGEQNSKDLMKIVDSKIMQYGQTFFKSDTEDKQKQKQQQEYKQKVQEYTKFKIGRKIGQHVQPYSQEQIEQGALIIKDSSVARVLMKWVQALQTEIQDPAKNTYSRDEPFRLSNEQQTYVLSQQKQIHKLYKFYERSAKVIKQKQQILRINARQIFLQALKSSESSKFKAYKAFSSQKDARIGHICTLLQKCKQNHISSYLNMLIGQIKYIEQEYQWQIMDKNVNLSSRPSLVTMKLGDLIRCQITSQQKQIAALYSYICLMCKCDPAHFELVRVKDRSNTANKDILINIFYHQKIVIQIQLAVKNQSAFISCSDKFSHFLYQMMRAFLGPVNQICSIWSQYSPKAPFFVQKFQQINMRSIENYELGCEDKKFHEFQDERKGFKLPFWCSYCGVLFYNDSVNRKYCRKCKTYRCGICEITDNEQKTVQNFIQDNYQNFQIISAPEIGKLFYALDIGTSYRHIKAMMKIQINGKMQVFSMKMQPGPQKSQRYETEPVISNIKPQYEISKRKSDRNLSKQLFEQSHIILSRNFKKTANIKRSQQRQKQIENKIITKILSEYYLPSRINNIAKKSQRFMRLTLFTIPQLSSKCKGELISNVLKKNTKTFALLQKLNLNDNGLERVDLAGKMPMIRVIAMCNNYLENLCVQGFKHLSSLDLSNNRIMSFDNIQCLKDCHNLQKIFLDQNEISTLQTLPKQLKKLQLLSLKNNKISIVNIITFFDNLACLNLNGNKINGLKNIENVKGLTELKLRGNGTIRSEGVGYLIQLKQLRKLDLSSTGLSKTLCQTMILNLNQKQQEIQQSIKSPESLKTLNTLTCLQELDLSENGLKFIPKLSKLRNLKQLNLHHNFLKDVKNLIHFDSLVWLNLKSNQISDLEGLKCLKSLKWIDLSDNQLESKCLTEISHLENIQEIQISQNYIKSLEGLENLKSLYQLSFRSNDKIKELKGIQKLTSLQMLDASSNALNSLSGIQNLNELFKVKLKDNPLYSVIQLKNVQNIKILELDGTSVSSFNEQVIPRLKNLQQLYMNKTGLVSLKGIQKFESLKKLQIKYNQKLQSLYEIKSLKFLNYISFSLFPELKIDILGRDEPPLEIIKIQKNSNCKQSQQQQLILTTLVLMGCNIQYEK